MTEINKNFPTWTTDKLFLTLSLKPSWRYYEFEKEFGLSVNDLVDFCDLFCTCDHRVQVYADATKSDLEHFANSLNEQEAMSQIKTDSFSNLFTDFMEEKGLSKLVIEFESLEAEGYFEYLAEREFIRDRTSQEPFWEEYEETTYEIEEWGDLFRKVIGQKDDSHFKITRHCRKCKKALPISRYFTDEALICKECQLARIKKIIK